MAHSKILIAYFSRKGNNYLNGRITNLPIGNTEIVAQKIQKLTGGDLFEIKPAKQYPEDYYEMTEVAKEEKRKNARPELANELEDISPYEVVFLGYPNWWGTMPMAVFTFLESYDFAGKTIAPFCTHEGSGLGSSERDIKKLCPKANVLPGLAIRGSSVNQADNDIQNWLSRLGLLT
ncbi:MULTISPECIES: flavodoxin [unclassified Caldicellulosiruptor]|uniref:flavodoxin n=1 Tax=unclassified Caldicellulosiruptor TaxID=2622462 RepID=UPI0003A1AF9C|nr:MULTISPECIES: flavodoxin [unclassified Caldicellulosiruptor]